MNDPNTHLTDEQLSTLVDDRLEAAERDSANRHLIQCDACSESLQELTYTVQAVAAMPDPALPRSFQIVETSKPGLWSRVSGWSIGLHGLAAAAAALFVVLLTLDMTAMTSPSSIVPLAPAAQSRVVVGTQKAQPTVVAPNAAAPAPASESARSSAPPASTGAGRGSQPASDQSANVSEAARLEALTARETSSNAPPRTPSAVTLAVGLIAGVLIVAAILRRFRPV
jgi:anti-sigma factor RsiW